MAVYFDMKFGLKCNKHKIILLQPSHTFKINDIALFISFLDDARHTNLNFENIIAS